MAKEEKKVKVTLLNDYWDETGERIFTGTKIDLPVSLAEALTEAGKVKVDFNALG